MYRVQGREIVTTMSRGFFDREKMELGKRSEKVEKPLTDDNTKGEIRWLSERFPQVWYAHSPHKDGHGSGTCGISPLE